MTAAVVIGGGMAGMLAAVSLSRFVDDLTVIDSDTFPAEPQPRKGLPQGAQNHMLMAGGAEAIDQLLPGTTALLCAAGAHRLPMGDRILTLSAQGWWRRISDTAYSITCSRALTDHIVRRQVMLNTQVRVLQATKAVGLTGDAARVTGVRVERENREQTLKAAIVVDASGGRTKSPAWLADLGLPPLEQSYVDPGLAYAGRVFEAPSDAPSDFPGVLIQPSPGTGRPGAGGAFMPQEDGRWIVALVGTAGGQPPTDEDGFQAFARGLPHPIIADLLATAKPLTPIRGSHGLANRRRHFERLRLPAGFVALGDAVMVLSPNYASGMSIAALGALALRTELKKSGLVPGLGARVQAELAKAGLGPWTMAAGTDRWYPGAKTNVTARGGAMQQRMAARVTRAAAERPEVLRSMYEMASLRATQRTAMTLPVLVSALRRLSKPQLSADEAIAQYAEIGDVLSRTPSPDHQAVRGE